MNRKHREFAYPFLPVCIQPPSLSPSCPDWYSNYSHWSCIDAALLPEPMVYIRVSFWRHTFYGLVQIFDMHRPLWYVAISYGSLLSWSNMICSLQPFEMGFFPLRNTHLWFLNALLWFNSSFLFCTEYSSVFWIYHSVYFSF